MHYASESGPPRRIVAEADLDRGRCRRLLTLASFAEAAVSPDGRAVAVTSDSGATAGLRVVTLAPGKSRLLRRAGVNVGSAVWSPDGRRLGYLQQHALRVIGADGRGDRLVSRFAAGWFDWAPDGTRIAFARTTGDWKAGTLRTTLDVITVAGRERRTLFVDPGPYGSQPNPVWSPDGSTIAFGINEPSRILAVAAGGGVVRTLTRGASPRWSPDGSRISFIGSGPAGVNEAWAMAADGSQKHRLTTSVAPARGGAEVRQLSRAMVARRRVARLRAQMGTRDDACRGWLGTRALPASLRHRLRRRRVGRVDFSQLSTHTRPV